MRDVHRDQMMRCHRRVGTAHSCGAVLLDASVATVWARRTREWLLRSSSRLRQLPVVVAMPVLNAGQEVASRGRE